MPPMGFEPTISEGERQQTYVLDRVATGTGISECTVNKLLMMDSGTLRNM